MKKLFKMFATLFAVSVLAFSFASCANDSSSDDNSNSLSSSGTLATFVYEKESSGEQMKLDADKAALGKEKTGIDFTAYIGKTLTSYKYKLYKFYDSEWEYVEYNKMTCESKTIWDSTTVLQKGTYEFADDSDFTDGELTLTQTHNWDSEKKELIEESATRTISINDGKIEIYDEVYTKL